MAGHRPIRLPKQWSRRVKAGVLHAISLANARLCALGSHDQINVTLENVKQVENLIDGFSVVCLIEDSVELRCRSSESADDLSL